MGINLLKELGYDENSDEVKAARKSAKFYSSLPALPEGLVWSIEDYYGNYDDGVYHKGQRVLVSIRKPGKFMWWKTNPRIDGVISLISDPRLGEDNILDSVQKVYENYQGRLTGL